MSSVIELITDLEPCVTCKKLIVTHFQCPECSERFCIQCAGTDYKGSGKLIKCPNCTATLTLPTRHTTQ
jgi:predicted RNA-binding Zn-ribbon protein involved in translation (DUF1610 family)